MKLFEMFQPLTEGVVTDAQGEPMRFYHGTTADFTRFNTNVENNDGEVGAFFSTSVKAVKDYCKGPGGRIIVAQLSISNPYEITNVQWGMGEGLSPKEARRKGYDGFIIRGMDGGDTYVVFDAAQIRTVEVLPPPKKPIRRSAELKAPSAKSLRDQGPSARSSTEPR